MQKKINSHLIHLGDCIEVMKKLPKNSVDSIVCDPPYGLGFMGREWDTFDKKQFGRKGNEGENDLKVKKNFNILPRYETAGLYQFTKEWGIEALRVLKHGGYLLSFAGSRTYHKVACGIEDAGFEIRDMIGWLYGSGFPKSYNIGKAVDSWERDSNYNETKGSPEWEGWGTALKPAIEPIIMARKPISEKSIAENVLKWGTGGINIDGCRIGYSNNETDNRIGQDDKHKGAMGKAPFGKKTGKDIKINTYKKEGRFPANIILDGSDEVAGIFPENANRFFYCAKSSVEDRNEGLERFEKKQTAGGGGGIGNYLYDVNSTSGKYGSENAPQQNYHPTVKPTELMQYLVRLVTPKGGVVLDPFMGSGSTGKACALEDMKFIGIEKEPEYFEIAEERIKHSGIIQRLF